MCVLEVKGTRKTTVLDDIQRLRALTSHTGYGQASRNEEVIVRREE